MRILGIAAEYNPFHNGHKYHIEKSKALTEADCVAVVMSGDFTQRGEPAVLDKWTRAELAVKNGADIVFELPFIFACNRAAMFARGSMDILIGAGATHISFGSESGDIDELKEVSDRLSENEEKINDVRSQYMKEGISFAKANEFATEKILGSEYARLIKTPNNILAIEYLKRLSYLNKLGCPVKPVTFRRQGSEYFDVNENAGFAGATVIRQMIHSNREAFSNSADCFDLTADNGALLSDIAKFVPDDVYKSLCGSFCQKHVEETEDRLFMLIRSEILKRTGEELSQIYCIGEGIENKFKKEILKAASLKEFISSAVSKRYTEAAIRRMLTYILLGMKINESDINLYGRILAAGEAGRGMLRYIKNRDKSDIPIISNINKEAKSQLKISRTLGMDILASDMYNIITGRDLYRNSDRVKMPYIK